MGEKRERDDLDNTTKDNILRKLWRERDKKIKKRKDKDGEG